MEAIQPVLIYQETNPYGSMTAYLEDDGRTIYLYLQSEEDPEKPIKTVWVKNKVPGPESRDLQSLKDGLAPVLCKDEIQQDNFDSLHPEDIHFIWLEEGNGLGLFHRDELIAYLPPWSGVKGFHGYSKYAKLESITAFPLINSESGVIADRIELSRKYWEFRAENNTWKEIQKLRLDYLEKNLGPHQKYWSADGGKFPQLGIVKFTPPEMPGIVVYSTIGMSAQNMPSVELYHRDYLDYSRTELLLALKTSEDDRSETWVPHVVGEIIKFPWMMEKWFGEGHNITMTRRDPESLYLNFTHFFISSKLPNFKINSTNIQIPCSEKLISENEKEIQFLFLLPITEEEVFFCKEKGASSFIQLIEPTGLGWVHHSERESFL